jgi:ABC-type amino acid transport substrate-binding protein
MHLRIGFDDPFAPFAWLDGGRPAGTLLERVAGLAVAGGCTAEFVALPIERSDEALRRGEVDLLAFKAVIPERREAFVFSRPLLSTGAALFAPAAAMLPGGGDVARCGGLRIATPAKGPLVAALGRACPDATVLPTDDYASALRAVLTGDADAAALNVHVGAHMARERFPGRFGEAGPTFARLELAMAGLRGRAEPIFERLGVGLA